MGAAHLPSGRSPGNIKMPLVELLRGKTLALPKHIET